LLKGGRYSYIKHFCLNETETGKVEGFTFTTEQAYRECYLKPFQMAIQEGGAVGIMTSFNRIGAVYSGGSEASITGVARTEWGFRGAIITDWANNNGYMSIDHQLRAGGDLGMNNDLNGYSGARFNYDQTATPRLQHQMKEAMHHVIYSWLRSQYLNKLYNENPDTDVKVIQTASIESFKWWKMALVDVNIVIGGAAAIFVIMAFLPRKKENL
jgi:beta-glucosidase